MISFYAVHAAPTGNGLVETLITMEGGKITSNVATGVVYRTQKEANAEMERKNRAS